MLESKVSSRVAVKNFPVASSLLSAGTSCSYRQSLRVCCSRVAVSRLRRLWELPTPHKVIRPVRETVVLWHAHSFWDCTYWCASRSYSRSVRIVGIYCSCQHFWIPSFVCSGDSHMFRVAWRCSVLHLPRPMSSVTTCSVPLAQLLSPGQTLLPTRANLSQVTESNLHRRVAKRYHQV